MEYATREQAQTAVQTLSNQNLMGRLVYVREVRVLSDDHFVVADAEVGTRIAKRNRALSVQPEAAAATVAAAKAAECKAATAVAAAKAVTVVVVVVVLVLAAVPCRVVAIARYTCLTFVQSHSFPS